MADLAVTTALTTIEEGLRDRLLLGLGQRFTPAAATVSALRAYASASSKHHALRYVTAAGYTYRFNRYSTGVDDGDAVIKPTDNPTAGRWLKTTSTVQTGYARAVELYEGESAAEDIIARFAARPAIVVVYQGEANTPISQNAGALYDYRPRFAIWMVSSNLRGEHQAATGSQISTEAAADPGANRMLGDVKSLLAGSDLDVTGVKWVELGAAERAYTSLADRLMVYQLSVEVRATVHIPDESLVTLDSVRTFDAQRQLVNLHGDDEFDSDNYLVSGITVPTGTGLTKSVASGSAKINGATVAYAGESRAFAASTDTYRDLGTGGTLTFVERSNGQDEPSVTSGALRIGVTVTDASGVTEDRIIAATLVNFGAVDQIPTT